MYFNVFAIIIILSYQCLVTCCFRKNINKYLENIPETQGCNIPISPTDFKLPIPYQNIPRSSIIHPDVNGNLHFERNSSIQLSCTVSTFKLSILKGLKEVTIICLGGRKVYYRGKAYLYYDFRCQSIPQSKLIKTSHKCQNNASIATVGFQTKYKFLILYHTCFDTNNTNALYSWYFATSPHYSNRLSYPERPIFIKSKQFFENIDIPSMYKKQSIMVLKTLRSKELMKKYINNETEYFLARGHLVARTEFAYGFEQEATFFYENTTPTWQVFNNNVWKRVESYVSKQLTQGNTNNLIITGTFGVCTLPDVDNVEKPLFLSYPDRIPVPLFIWKLVVNYENKKGIAFIGLNHPYKKIDKNSYMCKPIRCPEPIIDIVYTADKEHNALVYCCTKRSFEFGYGSRIHPIIFHRNLV